MCEIELQEFDTLKKLDGFLNVLSFYHVERCCHFSEKTKLGTFKNILQDEKITIMCSRVLFII